MAPFENRTELAAFTIVPANASQMEQHRRATHPLWGTYFAWDEWLRRMLDERANAPYAANGRQITWVLVRRDDPEGEIYAGCTTLRRRALVRRTRSSPIEGGTSYGIGDVVTPFAHLRKGYATHLLRLLHYMLGDPAQLPPFPSAWGAAPRLSEEIRRVLPYGVSSILWSDVGSQFYEKVSIGQELPGWVVEDEANQEVVWQLKEPVQGGIESNGFPTLPQGWSWIYEADLPSVGSEIKPNIERKIHSDPSGELIWALDPTDTETLSYIFVRGRSAYPQPSWRTDPLNEACGVRAAGAGADGGDMICLFSRYMPGIDIKRLNVFCTHNVSPDNVAQLIQVFDGIWAGGARETIDEGWVWGLSREATEAWVGQTDRSVRSGKRGEVKEHLLGVASYVKKGKGKLLDGEAGMWGWC